MCEKTALCRMVLLLIFRLSVQQHIIDDTCTYTLANKNKTETITFASQLYHVSSRYYDVYVNFCKGLGKVDHADPSCNAASQVCVIRRSTKKNILNKAVTGFQGAIEFNNDTKADEYFLMGKTQLICEGEPYEFKVLLDKKVDVYQISNADPCSMEIRIPHPNVLLRECEYSFNGIIINMKPLAEFSEQYVNFNTTKVALAACHSAVSCKSSARICEISPNGYQFDVADMQHIVYDERTNIVTVRGRKQTNKIKSEIIINCNWTTSFDNPTKLAAKYKYSIDSKYGCVKMPLYCEITDIEHHMYNLTSLNRQNGWRVGNSTLGTLSINVCGVLKHGIKNACSETFSQVCYKSGRQYLSYGALHSGLRFDGEAIILTYTHGSQCPTSPHEYLNTRITFECSSLETGPILSFIANCTMHISWKTPQACPYGISDDSYFSLKQLQHQLKETEDMDCSVFNNGQLFRLGSLKSNDSFIFQSRLRQNVKYYINICRPIGLRGDNYFCKITGACVEDNNEVDIRKKFTWIGSINEPRFENDELVIHYYGGYCADSPIKKREVIIHFLCFSSQQLLKLQSESSCRIDFVWNTPLACKQKTPRSVNCKTKSQNGDIIDLTKLTNRKFQIKYHNNTYSIDICSDSMNLFLNASAITNEPIVINATRQLFETDCNYWMQYNISNATKCDGSSNLQSLKIALICNEIPNNADHIGNYSLIDCDATVSLKTSLMCDYVQQCKKYPRSISQVVNQIPENEPKPVVCKITQNKNDIFINNIKEINVSVAGNNYSINGGECSGFVCRNNQTLATLTVCPNVAMDNENKITEVNLLGPICANGFYNVKLQFKCDANGVRTGTVPVQQVKPCSLLFLISGNETCALFKDQLPLGNKSQGSNNLVWIVGSVLCIIIIFSIGVTLWMHRNGFRCGNQTCADMSLRDRLLYFKNASD